MDATVQKPAGSRINWLNVLTVCSAAILIGAEVFGAAFAAGWAFSNLFHLGEYGTHGLQGAALRLATADGLGAAVLVVAAGIAGTVLVALRLGLRRECPDNASHVG